MKWLWSAIDAWKKHAMTTKYPLDGTEPSSGANGRPPPLSPEHIAVLHDLAAMNRNSLPT
jgi:hypothetical protein